MREAVQAFLLAFPALLSIVNPLSGALIFREITADLPSQDRGLLARRVAFFAFVVMMAALWAGPYVLAFFGISLAALRVAGGLVVALAGWDLLNTPERRESSRKAHATSAGREDMAFYPLTMPLTTGPGTISVAVTLGAGHPSPGDTSLLWYFLGMSAAALAIAVVILVTFDFADKAVSRLGPSGSRIVTRLLAFLLLCIGVQILISGVQEVLTPLLAARG